MTDMRTPFARVAGSGAAKEGTEHFFTQRVSALALIPLTIWFLASLVGQAGADYESFRAWIASPLTAGPLILLIGAGFYHGHLGVQVVIEDYIHGEGMKVALLILNKFWAIAAGVVAIWSVLSASLAG